MKLLNLLFGFIPRYFDKLAAANKIAFMTDPELMAQINQDAAEGFINTPYSREYDRRRPVMNARA